MEANQQEQIVEQKVDELSQEIIVRLRQNSEKLRSSIFGVGVQGIQIKGNEELLPLQVLDQSEFGQVQKVFDKVQKKFYLQAQVIATSQTYQFIEEQFEVLQELSDSQVQNISRVLGFESYELQNRIEYHILSEYGECTLEHISEVKKALGSTWTEHELLSTLRRISEPINLLHTLNIFHKNIRPQNFILQSDLISIKLINLEISEKIPLNQQKPIIQVLLSSGVHLLPPEAQAPLKNGVQQIECNPYQWDCYQVGLTLLSLINSDVLKSQDQLKVTLQQIETTYPKIYRIVGKMVDETPVNRPSLSNVLNQIDDTKLISTEEFDYIKQKIRNKHDNVNVDECKRVAQYFIKIQDFDSAKENLEEFLNKIQDSSMIKKEVLAELNYLLGQTLYFLGEYTRADDHLKKSLTLYSNDANEDTIESSLPLIYLGRLKFEIGERKEAIQYIERAYQLRRDKFGESNILTLEVSNYYLQFLIVLRQDEDLQGKLVEYIYGEIQKPEIKETEIGGKSFEIYGFYKLRKKQYDDTLQYYLQAQKIYEKVIGENSVQMANIYYRLGYYYQERSQYDLSLQMYLKTKDIRIKLLGVDHPLVGDVYSGIGWIYYRQNKSSECWDAFYKCKELYEKGYGTNNLITASAYYSVGVVQKWYRRYNESETFLLKCYDIKKDKLGENHSELSACCVVLGNLNNDQGKYEEAKNYYEKGLKIAIENKEELDQAFNYYNLGDIHFKACEYEESIAKFEKVYEIRQRILGENDNLTLFTLKFLHDCKLKLGKVDEALEAINKFVEGQTKIFGPSSNSTSWAYWYRAQYYYDFGLYDQAIEDCRQAQKTLPTNTLVRTIIGKCQFQLGEIDTSFTEVETCLNSRKDGFADRDLEFAQYYQFYCEYYQIKEDYAQVHQYANELYQIPSNKIQWSQYHCMYADSYYYHGLAYLEEKQYENARDHLEKALLHANKIYGEDTLFCAKYNIGIARYYLALNEPQTAKTYLETAKQALEAQKVTVNPDYYGDTLFLLAQVYIHQGEKDKSREYSEGAITSYQTQFPDTHPKLQAVQEHLKTIQSED